MAASRLSCSLKLVWSRGGLVDWRTTVFQATARRSNVPISRVLGVYVREAKERLLTELASKRTIKGPHVPRESVLTTFKTTLTFEDRDLERIQGDLDPDRVMSRSLALARAIAAEIKTRK